MKCGTDDLLQRMRAMAADHAPDGWPAVRMCDITALCDEIERLRAEAAKSEGLVNEFSDICVWQVIVMRAAVVDCRRSGADAGMRWITGALFDPDCMPSDEDIALGAQALADREVDALRAFRAAHPAPAETASGQGGGGR